MAEACDPSITQILLAMRERPDGREQLAENLYASAYPHLREIARSVMNSERPGHTLQPTALVNEAFMALVDQNRTDWQGRSHFLSIAARIMRRILVDHARARGRAKRGGDWQRVTLDSDFYGEKHELDALDMLVLDETLERLEALHARMARVVELRVFGGMTMVEIAHVLDVSKRTVDEDWSFSRRWLARELSS